MRNISIINLGDSISYGMGVSPTQMEKRYIITFQKSFVKGERPHLFDLSENGCTSKRAYENISSFFSSNQFKEHQNDRFIIVIGLGNVDAKLICKDQPSSYAGINFYRLLPKRYQGANLDPRPYFSRKFFKCIFQKVESLVRVFIKRFLMWIQGTENIVDILEFEKYILIIIDLIYRNVSEFSIYILSTVPINHFGFKGSSESFKTYDEILRNISISRKNVIFVDIKNELETFKFDNSYFCDDGFHLKAKAHDLVARKLLDAIQ